MTETNLHANGVCFSEFGDPAGVLIRGVPGAGKSDLTLRLLDEGAVLIGDDQLWLSVEDNTLYARPPAQTTGRLEVRGLGLVDCDSVSSAPIRLVVSLVPLEDIQRLPEPETETLMGVTLPRIRLYPFEAAATIKLRLALKLVLSGKFPG